MQCIHCGFMIRHDCRVLKNPRGIHPWWYCNKIGVIQFDETETLAKEKRMGKQEDNLNKNEGCYRRGTLLGLKAF